VDETMKPDYPINAITPTVHKDLIRQVVYHKVGHAAAIHLYNRKKQLPSVSFQIVIKQTDYSRAQSSDNHAITRDHFTAIVEGGSLIHSHPLTLTGSLLNEKDPFRAAYEADMINLLVGPLAEAKHVALRDDECFTKNLITFNVLNNYGGSAALEKVYEYLEYFGEDLMRQEEKLAELFNQAFIFIESPVHWQAIERLAAYIFGNMKNVVRYEESVALLDGTAIVVDQGKQVIPEQKGSFQSSIKV
jgi:hypothetical protein